MHFGHYQDITRVEVVARRQAIEKNNWDLLDLLNPAKHRNIFYTLLGDKLRFKDLDSKYWDGNNNLKFKTRSLLPEELSMTTKFRTIYYKTSVEYRHRKSVRNNNAIKWFNRTLFKAWLFFNGY